MSDKDGHRPFDDPIPLPNGPSAPYPARCRHVHHGAAEARARYARMARGDRGADACGERGGNTMLPRIGVMGRAVPE